MFEGFETHDIETNGTRIHAVVGGDGPPLLLLHGYPQTHAMWYAVAPELARSFTVVAADLRGYGDSGKPPLGDDRLGYAKRTMANDMVGLMEALGFERFAVAGHDRGGRVTYRMAFDHPERVTRAAVLDIVPTQAMWAGWNRQAALGGYHWTFLAQPAGFPERLIGADPLFFLHDCLGRWAGPDFTFDGEAMEAYERAFANPETVRASCDDYRAGATIDVEIDEADQSAGRKIGVPLLAMWGEGGAGRRRGGIVETWREWADDVRGVSVACGHFLPEEAPAAVLDAFRDFFS